VDRSRPSRIEGKSLKYRDSTRPKLLAGNMDRFAITIQPAPFDAGLLRVSDAMQQVIDTLMLFDDAERSTNPEGPSFEWRLEQASTNSPFTVIARADAIRPHEDVSENVRRVKAEVSKGLKNLMTRGEAAPWMNLQRDGALRRFLSRNQNGVGRTDIDFMEGDSASLSIDRASADAGMRALAAINVIDVSADLYEREAFGEIEGVMVAAGRYRGQPAIQIRSEFYGFVWCSLTQKIILQFGSEHAIKDVWEGKSIGVQGVLSYGIGGKLLKIGVHDIREIESVERIDITTILDPSFTSGLEPDEYLRLLHEGELA
jgi:hypothetical protein